MLLTLWAAMGPNGHLVGAELEHPQVEEVLPVADLLATSGRLYVVFHHQDAWPRAVYASPELSALIPWVARSLGSDARLLPDLRVPRLLLYAPYYQRGEGLKPLGEMAIDVSSKLFTALVEARLELAADPVLHHWITQRGGALMPEAPSAQRASAFSSAVANFAGHALVVAKELGRHHRRVGASGALCPMLERLGALFGTWNQIFEGGRYYGQYLSPGSQGLWKTTRRPLEPQDKLFALRHLFANRWTGDPRQDFAWACPEG